MRLREIAFALCLLVPASASADHATASADVSACFKPGPESCAERLADRIDAATSTVRVQAFELTQPLITRAIATAKKRGFGVAVILDKSQDRHGSIFVISPGCLLYILLHCSWMRT